MMNAMMHETFVIGTASKAEIPGWEARRQDRHHARISAMPGSSASPATSSPASGSATTTATPTKRVSGGNLPAEVWHDFMQAALKGKQPVALPGSDRFGALARRRWPAARAALPAAGAAPESAWIQPTAPGVPPAPLREELPREAVRPLDGMAASRRPIAVRGLRLVMNPAAPFRRPRTARGRATPIAAMVAGSGRRRRAERMAEPDADEGREAHLADAEEGGRRAGTVGEGHHGRRLRLRHGEADAAPLERHRHPITASEVGKPGAHQEQHQEPAGRQARDAEPRWFRRGRAVPRAAGRGSCRR